MSTQDKKPEGEGVLAGHSLSAARRVRTEGFDASSLDEVSLHLARLKALHPSLAVNFRAADLIEMTKEERQELLCDCYDALGIEHD